MGGYYGPREQLGAKLLGRKRLVSTGVALGQVVCREGFESQDGDQGEGGGRQSRRG